MSDFEVSSETSEPDYVSDDSGEFVPTQATKKKKASKPLADTTNNAPTSTISGTKGSSASEQYQKLSQLEHILKRPDTYIGSVEKTGIDMWCFDAVSEQMKFQEVNIVPGLYKIFDEILVNAADNKIRDPSMKNIKVKIDPENNLIQVMNDGKGIPVEVHTKENMYIPELIFGNLLTSSNYDDDQKKVTGGRNGYGAKLCNIFSTEFIVETADLSTGLCYKQVWTENMSKVSKPKITKLKTKKEYTKITFKPDLTKFHMDSLDDEILSVMRRRIYDLCGTVKDCNIYLNEKRLPIKNFKAYVEMYVKAIAERKPDIIQESSEPKNYQTIVHEVVNDRWELAFAVSDGNFNQVSFVNSIATTSGGTHVKYISDQIISKLIETLEKKEKGKKKLMIKPQEVRNKMFLFVNCLIENPAFTSQTKEQLTTRVAQFGGKPSEKVTISDQFINKILKTSIVDEIRTIARLNEDRALQKVDGSKKQRIKGQVKLVDANKAGTRIGHQCTLILTEGDSALSLAVAGLAVVGRDLYGCFPLKGKLLNVREASIDQISKNTEINALKKIIGLQHKKQYDAESIKTLRYGHIMIMTDQDQDGSHIKGLIINFLETSFPGLLETPGFLLEFITPIVKVTIKNRGSKQVIPFYNMPEFEAWREDEGARCRWTHKYYKGLGTSSPMEAREYFAALDRHLKTFHAIQGDDRQFIDLAFSKKKADDRKEWLQSFQPGTHLDPNLSEIPISDFINKELILFSMADNVRSIPSVLDGFKPGQRKVLFGCFKRNLKSEIKVSQLVGYISEHTGYHHGEASLIQTVIGLAQDFIGSNNINVLKPIGAFGTRAAGGKDFSAARYIFTDINDITRKIFNHLDEPLYTYLQEDEQTVEPEWYLPVLPMVLVNGAEGIGTGWSTNIPSYNPEEIVNNLKRLMNGEELMDMMPWYKGWEGDIEQSSKDKFKVSGKIQQLDDNTLEITEIPIKTWINNMKEYLLTALGTDKTPAWIKDMEEQHGINISFIIKLSKEEMEKSYKIGLLERFKLISSISLSNMVAFDPHGKIKRYDSPLEIIKDFYYVRLEYYQKRKDYMTQDLQNQLTKLSEQARFIKLIIDKQLSVSNKKRAQLVKDLEKFNFTKFNKQGQPVEGNPDLSLFVDPEEILEEAEEEEDVTRAAVAVSNTSDHIPETSYSQYDYLLGMSIWSLTRERYEKLLKQRDDKQEELTDLLKLTAKDLWNADLDEFVKQWHKFLQVDYEQRATMIPNVGTKSKAKRRKVKQEPGDAQPSKKRATKVKPTSNEKLLSSSSTESVTSSASSKPSKAKVSAVKKEQQPDVLSFFSRADDNSKTPSDLDQDSNDHTTSHFNDSDDDLLLGSSSFASADPPKSSKRTSSSASSLTSKKKTPTKTSSPSSSSTKSALTDEINDLKSELKIDTSKPRRKSNSVYDTYPSDSDVFSDDIVDDANDDDDDDAYVDD
ncbi:uncharacterized protein PRCAT00002126001 [Priceomyces carsonii]|uniref:uncharacterized protein n=1 Tax=Priceomyces carsonii TaxID=28549 RepID=UPI002ED9D3A6|nr:unnamed protein product [Priceomyces carsonii]